MAGYIDSVLPAQTQSQVYTEILANHVANGVPVSSWRSLVNVGLSLTQYVSEASSTALTLARTVFRGMFADSIFEDISTAPNATTLAQVTQAAEAFALSQYQEAAQPATLATLRVVLSASSGAAVNSFTSGLVIVGTPSVSAPLLYTLIEALTLDPSGRVVALCRATSPGSGYNLASDSPFELKTTFVGVTAAVPSTGERLTVGTGNYSLTLSAGDNLGANSGEEVAIEFVVDAPNVATLTVTSATTPSVQTLVTVHMRSDGASVPLSTAAEIRAGICAQLSAAIIAGAQLPSGTTGGAAMPVSGPFVLPRANGPVQTAGQNSETASALMTRSIAKWDALSVGTGTDDALYYWVTKTPAGYTASPVAQAQVINARKSDGTTRGGWITILVTGLLGPLSVADLAAVTANLYNPRKFANFAKLDVINAATNTITVTAHVQYLKTAKLTDADVTAAISSAFLRLQARLQMGVQTIDPSLIEGTIFDASDAIWVVTLSAPAAPTLIAWDERPAFALSGMTYEAVDA